jgi:eight-cysteine-cluster-containing protein
MFGSLKALAAISILSFSACASTGVEDELAGETSEDAALDGKADGAVDGAYTYFEIYKDVRKCASPSCGGYFLHRLNRTSTVCHNGTSRWSCYVPGLDWTESNLGSDLQRGLDEAALRDASSYGVIAIVRGRFAPQSYTGFGNLGRFVVTEAWVAENDSVSEGVFTRVHDNGVRCITTPCPTIGEKALNTSRSANVHGLDWSAGGFDDDQISKLATEMVSTPGGILIAGDRYTFRENNQNAKGRTVTAAYRRLVDQTCYVGGCSGQVCSDQEGVITTCEWRDEYACYQTASCERQPDGQCGWTPTEELNTCLGQP